MPKFEIGDRVKINDEGRSRYACDMNSWNPLNFTGTVVDRWGQDLRVKWDNGNYNSYAPNTLTKIGG